LKRTEYYFVNNNNKFKSLITKFQIVDADLSQSDLIDKLSPSSPCLEGYFLLGFGM